MNGGGGSTEFFVLFLQLLCTLGLVKKKKLGFPAGALVKNPPANTGDTGSSPGLGRSHMLRSN